MNKQIVDINEVAINNYIESIRPKNIEIRKELDIGYSYDDLTFEIFEIRPVWNDPSQIEYNTIAKIKFFKTKKHWKLYWQRANGKMDLHKPFPSSTTISEIINIIEEDEFGSFFG